MGSDIAPEVTGRGRTGDVRHCLADIARARCVLGYLPSEDFRNRLVDLAEWVIGQDAHDGVAAAANELRTRGLMT
jgi:dTDP-L-rhamnose 4-epimerase